MKLPRFSIAAKLYAIFALLATVTVALAAIAAANASRHAALTAEFGAAFKGGQNIERINALSYALLAQTRGIYLAEDAAAADEEAQAIGALNDRLSAALQGWRETVQSGDDGSFAELSGRIRILQDSSRAVVRRLKESGLASARQMASFDNNGAVYGVLSNDLQRLAKSYSARADRAYAGIEESLKLSAWLTGALGILAVLLAGGRCLPDLARGGAAARAHHRRHRGDRRRPRPGRGPLPPSWRRGRRARPVDRGVPRRHAPQRGAQPHRGR